jgi:hypothetical protein
VFSYLQPIDKTESLHPVGLREDGFLASGYSLIDQK